MGVVNWFKNKVQTFEAKRYHFDLFLAWLWGLNLIIDLCTANRWEAAMDLVIIVLCHEVYSLRKKYEAK